MLMSILETVDHIFYTFICFFGSILLLTLVHLVDTLKYKWPCNWLAIGICYELTTLGMGTFVMNTSLNTIMMAVSMALLIFGFVLIICFFILVGYNYPNPYKMAALSALGLILVIGNIAAGSLYHWEHWVEVALVLFILSVLILMISYVLISFKNLDILIKADTLLLGFVLYMYYVLFMLACFIFIQRFDINFDTKPSQKASPYG
ncbi:hypothetical protein ACLKA7_001079 [Drosophila subpalustris]